MFTDGSAPSTNFTLPDGDSDEDSAMDCVGINRSDDMKIVPCDIPGKYMCMTNGK